MTDLTVAVCTYRRGELLRRTLDSLVAAERPGASWELVVVDNAADPAVRVLVDDFAGRLPVRYVAEPTTGCSHARNRAVAEAAAPVLLFTDDDAVVHRGWLKAMAAAVAANPGYEFWGGRVRPVWVADRPDWFDDAACPMLRDVIVQYDAGDESRPWNPDRDLPFFTCNLALRVEAVKRAGLFDPALGHVGDKRVGNEDTRLQQEIVRRGGRGWYEPAAVVDHPVPADRSDPAYALDFARRQGWLSVEFLARDHGGRVPRWLYKAAAAQLGRGWLGWAGGVVVRDRAARFAGRMAAANAAAKLGRAVGFGGAA